MTDLEGLLLRCTALQDLVTECEVLLDQHFAGDPDPTTTLQALIEGSGGPDTPIGRGAELYRLRLVYQQHLKRLRERCRLRAQRARCAVPKLLTTTWSGAPPRLLTTTAEPIRPVIPLEIGTSAPQSGESA